MVEHPVIFNTEMVKAILAGRKTQTRRVIKPQPPKDSFSCFDSIDSYQGEGWFFQYPVDVGGGIDYSKKFSLPQNGKCPYGKIGDRLWVRETHMVYNSPEFKSLEEDMLRKDLVFYKASDRAYKGEKWKPSIHMFRRHSRINLEITDIRVERVQDIYWGDLQFEGYKHEWYDNNNRRDFPTMTKMLQWFIPLWNSMNAKRGYGWNSNPWVWIIEFRQRAIKQ